MEKDCFELRQRFMLYNWDRWSCKHADGRNYKSLSPVSGVYYFVSFNGINNIRDIVYIGSSTNLQERYKVHKIPFVIREEKGCFQMLFFKEMEKGFYDFEIKLIKKLQPKLNKQHRGKNG